MCSVESAMFKLWHQNFFLIHTSFLSAPESVYKPRTTSQYPQIKVSLTRVSQCLEISRLYELQLHCPERLTVLSLDIPSIPPEYSFTLPSFFLLAFREGLWLFLNIFSNVHRVIQLSFRCFWFCDDRCKKTLSFILFIQCLFLYVALTCFTTYLQQWNKAHLQSE